MGVGRFVAVLALVAGCSADLPAGWEDAEPIEMTQSACKTNVLGAAPNEGIRTSLSGGTVDLTYEDAHFRCEQEVEGFIVQEFGSAKLLFQPTDLEPGTVARCDCTYDITTSIKGYGDPMTLQVYRRWDSIGGEKEPVLIGERTIDF